MGQKNVSRRRTAVLMGLEHATNLSVRLDGRFPDVLQSQSFAVVDQNDALNVLPQLTARR